MAKETDFSNAIYELEKTLACPSCGKVTDLRTHVECGASKCVSCWRQQPKCPCCQKSVDEKNTWDLGDILALNADRADIKPDGPVDAFLFLKALRDYNEASKENQNDDDKKPKANDSSPTKETDSPTKQEKLVDRNSFGGKAFYGGDQSGKANTTGRIGRRRLERQQQQASPPQKQQDDSFDDSMFDFHSQSSMPTSQVSMVASQTSSMPAPQEEENSKNDGTKESLQQHGESKSGDAESPRASQCSQRQQESLVESNHSTKDESESQQEKESEAADDAVQHEQDQSHSSMPASQGGTMAASREQSGALEDARMDDSEPSQQADERKSQQGDNFDSQETRLESSSCPAETTTFMDVDTTDNDMTEVEVPSKQSRRRVTIQSPVIQEDTSETKSLASTRKANFRSVVTPASSSRKRQRTESCFKKSPIDEESRVGVDDLRASLDAAAGEGTSGHRDDAMASGEGDKDAEHDTHGETCFVTPAARKTGIRETESQETSQSNHSIDSTVLPSTLDLNPQSVSVTMEEPCSQSSMPHSSPSRNDVEGGDTNVGSSVGLDHRKAVEIESLVLGGGDDGTMLEAGNESASKEPIDDDMHISEETQQTVLPSQELPITCDFLRSFASSRRKGTMASDEACELSLNEKGAVIEEARDSNQGNMASTEVCVMSTSKAVASNPDQGGEKGGTPEDGNFVRGASHGQGNIEIAGGSSSLATPVIRPGSTVDSQGSFNSQMLPSSIDFRNDLHYLMPPPSASQSAHSDDVSKIQFSNTDLITSTGQTSEEPNTLGGLLGAQSSSPVNDDEIIAAVVYEPSLRKDNESKNEKESDGKDDEGPVDHQLRKDSIATASLDSDNQRVYKRRELLPSPPDSQETMVSSQHMPNTCDFLRAFVPPVAPTTAESDSREDPSLQTRGDIHSVAPSDEERTLNPLVTCGANSNLVDKEEGKTQKDKSVNSETVGAPVTADAASHDERTSSSGPTLCATPVVQKRPVREVSSTGCSIHSDLSQRSRGDSETTCLDESQNSLASCMIPATQELGGLFHSRQQSKTLPSVAPVAAVSFATSNVSNVTRLSEKSTHGDTGESVCRQGDTTVRSDIPNNAKTAMDPIVDSSHLNNSERVSTDTQQTVLQSQNLPSINDFCALFPSAVSVDERKETSGGLPLGAPQNKVEHSNAKQPDSTHDVAKQGSVEEVTTRGLKREASGSNHLHGNEGSASQASMHSQLLPNTCDFGRTFPAPQNREFGRGLKLSEVGSDSRHGNEERNDGSASQASMHSQLLPNTCDFGRMFPAPKDQEVGCGLELSENTRAALSSSDSKPLRVVLDPALEDEELHIARRLCKSGVIKASDLDVTSSTTHFVPYTRADSDPVSKEVEVCLPTLSYFKALVLGIPIVGKSWLKKMEVDGIDLRNEDAHHVWGDSGLHQKVKEMQSQNGSDRCAWLKSTEWWKDKCGPAQLPLSQSTDGFDGYCILVPEQHYCRPLANALAGGSPESSPVDIFESSTRESGMAEDPGSFQYLTKQEIETLCHLLGATVVQTTDELESSDPNLTRLVLVPASLPPDHFSLFAEQRLSNAMLLDPVHLASTSQCQKVWALRSTWLTDSVAARFHAPLDKYSYGILFFQDDSIEENSSTDVPAESESI